MARAGSIGMSLKAAREIKQASLKGDVKGGISGAEGSYRSEKHQRREEIAAAKTENRQSSSWRRAYHQRRSAIRASIKAWRAHRAASWRQLK